MIEQKGRDYMNKTLSDQYGIYLYCIINFEEVQKLDNLGVTGIDGSNTLFLVTYQDISAVVSAVALSEFGDKALDENLNNMQWLEKKALLHEYILEKILNICNLIPMRFCTIYKNREGVEEALAGQYDTFVNSLKFIDNKEEWGLKIFYDQSVLESEIATVSDRIKKMQNELKGMSSGKAFFLKKKLDNLIKEEAEQKAFIFADECHHRINEFAERSSLNKLLGKETTGNQKDMVLNAAYLVPRDEITVFRQEVASLEKELGGMGLEFCVSGPWPAYHFCWITQDRGEHDE